MSVSLKMTEKTAPKILYVCYFGLREPLVQTQVLPYLLEVLKDGNEVILLTFEPDPARTWTAGAINAERELLKEKGIRWLHLTYHKSPSVPATFYDILNGARLVSRLIDNEHIDLLHCRIHIPALMAAVARKFSRKNPKLLFDIRGFFPEEYTDAGIWPENGWLYRAVKRVEKWLLKESDGFVVLTEKARQILFPESVDSGRDKLGRPVEVIPCCVDLQRFATADDISRENVRRELDIHDRFVFVYIGSFGGWYLTNEMLDFLRVAKQQNEKAFALIITQRETEKAENMLRDAGLHQGDHLVISVTPQQIPRFLKAADVAISFIKSCYSKQAASPTKIAEYLAAGLPVVSNAGVGDLDELIDGEKVGVILEGLSDEDYLAGLAKIERYSQDNSSLPEHCKSVAHRYFDLTSVGGERYRRLYKRILNCNE